MLIHNYIVSRVCYNLRVTFNAVGRLAYKLNQMQNRYMFVNVSRECYDVH